MPNSFIHSLTHTTHYFTPPLYEPSPHYKHLPHPHTPSHSQEWPEDHLYKYMDPGIMITQPCNVAGSLAFTDTGTSLCHLRPDLKE